MNTIFVFGSNRQGRHGLGAAKEARLHHGAIYGQAEGLQGRSYAIITKELRASHPPVSLPEVAAGVSRFLSFASSHPHLHFHLTPIGCGLAGFTPAQIGPLFRNATANISLPPAFLPFSA